MLKFLKFLVFTAVIFVFQFMFNTILDVRGIFPDLILIYMAYLAFRLPPLWLVWAAFLLGISQDIFFNIGLIGLNPLVKVITALGLIKIVEYERNFNNIVNILLIAFLFLIAINFYDSLFFFGLRDRGYSLVLKYSLPKTLYTISLLFLINFYFPVRRS